MITDKALEALKQEKAIKPKLLSSIFLNSHFVQLGSVGPDYPYLDIFQPNQKTWADHMHYDHTGDFIASIARKLLELSRNGLEKKEFVIPFCWSLGYISHVTADLVVHPVVFNIVGPYAINPDEHFHCEMIQDVFIYNKVRNGAEIKHGALLKVIKNSSDTADENKIHPILQLFWKGVLEALFNEDYKDHTPEIDKWHNQFATWLGLASQTLVVGRILDPNNKISYKLSTEIKPEEKQRYIDKLPLPIGGWGKYETEVFEKAKKEVMKKWTLLISCLYAGSIDPFLSVISNCDLDNGRDNSTGKLIYWER